MVKNYLIMIIMVIILSSCTYLRNENKPINTDSKINKTEEISLIDELDQRGCCSHHGGVCGCKDNRALCCDGKLSPSCGCK